MGLSNTKNDDGIGNKKDFFEDDGSVQSLQVNKETSTDPFGIYDTLKRMEKDVKCSKTTFGIQNPIT